MEKRCDGPRQKLTMPTWQIPYLEKHKIMEVFHELAREMVIQQPVDHIMFMKQLLQRAAKSIGIARVILLSSPRVNCLEVAKQISQQTEQVVVTEDMILSHLNITSRDQLRPNTLAMCLTYLLHTEAAQNCGWILVDCIKCAKEAKKIVQTGVIPTHVLHLIPPFSPSLNELLYCGVHADWPIYRREVMVIRDVFKTKLVEIFLRQRFIHEVVRECIEVCKIMKGIGCPKQARVVILGPRGSGRNTQGALVAEKLNLVHIDFQYLLCQVWNSDGELGDKLRACRNEVCYHSELLAQVVNGRILEEDCLTRGWVLTGFPYTVTDFKYVDTLDTPPNRVIFLECDLNLCRERLINRRVNVYSGSTCDVLKEPEMIHAKHLSVHPKDSVSMVNAEMAYYCEQYGGLRNYCGESGVVVNADQPERWVCECILAAVARGTLAAPARRPCLKEDQRSRSSLDDDDDDVTDSSVEPTQIFGYYSTKM